MVALSTFPIVLMVGNTSDALRISALIALAYSIVHVSILVGRSRRDALPRSRAWFVIAGAIDIATLVTVFGTVATGTVQWYEALLLVLLARPMLAFLLVLASFESMPGSS